MSAVRTPAFKFVADRSSLDLLSRRFLFCSALLILAPSWLEKTASARTNAEMQNVTGGKRPMPRAAKRQGPTHAHKPAAVSAVESVRSEAVSVHGAISTSRRQILKRQNDPVSVTTVTEKDLQTHQITNLPQAIKLLPSVSLQVSNPRNTAINIRGLGNFSSTAQDGLENGTAVYIDGVYQTRPGAVLGDISDLAGIEVLKGPQATRGGIDNDSGIINITTLAPSFKRQYTVTGDYGSYNTANIRVRATGAVGNSDKVAYSLSGFSMNRDGYVKNVTTNKYYYGVSSVKP
ncbi:TonB-dependent receptor plug domain-containing protein [Acetobacter pasteurianus]|uniref:TonB-dependent receptor n=2 Tax=Acetobacter pasteurianus TaxID=438 RepID=C7JHR8_ACEP3|nr:TonB-dependent receptor plug domain-containing protein [Acetobacter pasteurianus]ASC06978.1 hypothetical protein S101468_02776 [Acetobacter pasteurianus subsp. pasteurianus]BAH99522.1 TonB-dependent receptor [Acetobacter pasteurianus IFO 3283-01]BAI02575.1 TonB-dependent receptor [Acetobacter pasteurianus IFO 3283-03]BAI05621.1 TonB-dependent receptor [Acetobacter pasteurianus IFO 3283-07]BAI08670.1 TonB-dependent receptor [Acetobacter pasteurianus IFO 3283-22]